MHAFKYKSYWSCVCVCACIILMTPECVCVCVCMHVYVFFPGVKLWGAYEKGERFYKPEF